MTSKRLFETTSMIVVLLLGFSAAVARPLHEEGVLALGSSTAAAGSTLGATGSDFSAGTRLTLVLRGALEDHELATVETDADGAFSANLEIPAEVRSGVYRLEAVAPDGDVTATADLEISRPAGGTTSAVDEGDDGSGQDTGGSTVNTPTARADEREIRRDWSGIEWFVVGAALSGALVGGIALYRR